MKICFIHSEKPRERDLADAFCEGLQKYGIQTELSQKSHKLKTDADAVCFVGVKSIKLIDQANKQKLPFLFFDKGYLRHRGPSRVWEFWRIAVNGHHPTDYLSKAKHSSARWDVMAAHRGLVRSPWRTKGEHIIYLGSSAKYHNVAGLAEDPNEIAASVIYEIKQYTDRPIHYRPKPSFHEARAIYGAFFDQNHRSIDDALQNAWATVTHGSNACFESVMSGVPSIVLGDAIARPISCRHLSRIEDPYLAPDEDVLQWLHNLAWCMFTEDEMKSGLAWKVIEPFLQKGRFVDEESLPSVTGAITKSSHVIRKEAAEEQKRIRRRKRKVQRRAQKKK